MNRAAPRRFPLGGALCVVAIALACTAAFYVTGSGPRVGVAVVAAVVGAAGLWLSLKPSVRRAPRRH